MKTLTLKETALKEEIKEILEELENMYEISELEEQVNNINKIRDYIINLQQENKQLQERIEYLERSNNRREDTILEQRQEISDLEDNWNNLKKDIGYELLKLREPNEYNKGLCNAFNYINNKMRELEQGSDSNE